MNRDHRRLSRRERQIIDALYEKGRATALEILESLPDPPSYSTIRSHLTTLEEKGHVRHEKDGAKYVYIPVVHASTARRSALHLVKTFFLGSREQAVAALLDVSPSQFSDEELDRLAEKIQKVRKERGR